jgi:hypothetical protein
MEAQSGGLQVGDAAVVSAPEGALRAEPGHEAEAIARLPGGGGAGPSSLACRVIGSGSRPPKARSTGSRGRRWQCRLHRRQRRTSAGQRGATRASAKGPNRSSAAAPAAAGERRYRPTQNAPGHRRPGAFHFSEDYQTVRMKQARRGESPNPSGGLITSHLCGGTHGRPHCLVRRTWVRCQRTEADSEVFFRGRRHVFGRLIIPSGFAQNPRRSQVRWFPRRDRTGAAPPRPPPQVIGGIAQLKTPPSIAGRGRFTSARMIVLHGVVQ